MSRKAVAKINYAAKKVVLFLLKAYKYCISPFLGQNCRFYPSCSCYAHEAIENYGIIYGSWLGLKRLLKCHPWHPGGVDLVPQQQKRE
ncbi:MAG: membrane protein insertion efficiency factor YidD [Gammaproteobacteria bacterium]|nr:membrane protein insertion efficiency factor YidD [Gammaproteobacteria bacterium]